MKFKVGDKVRAFGLDGEVVRVGYLYAETYPIKVKFGITDFASS